MQNFIKLHISTFLYIPFYKYIKAGMKTEKSCFYVNSYLHILICANTKMFAKDNNVYNMCEDTK